MEVFGWLSFRSEDEYKHRYDQRADQVEDEPRVGLQSKSTCGDSEQGGCEVANVRDNLSRKG